jgi:hypothetical protein
MGIFQIANPPSQSPLAMTIPSLELLQSATLLMELE